MAPRALSKESCSIASEISKRTMTIAASAQEPINTAPVTATAIRAFMLKLRFLMAIKPFL